MSIIRANSTAVPSDVSDYDKTFSFVHFLLFTILYRKRKILDSQLDAVKETKMVSSIFYTFLRDDVIR